MGDAWVRDEDDMVLETHSLIMYLTGYLLGNPRPQVERLVLGVPWDDNRFSLRIVFKIFSYLINNEELPDQ